MYVLTCGDYDHIVHWKTDDIFVINDINAFTNEVLPSFFKVAKYESFQRKLYRWGFVKTCMLRIEKKRSISYSHPLFEKGDFALAAQMTCCPIRCPNPMSITNPENYFSGHDVFSIRGNFNFSTHERIEDCHPIAHNQRFTRSVQSVEQTFNSLSIDQILEHAYSILRE